MIKWTTGSTKDVGSLQILHVARPCAFFQYSFSTRLSSANGKASMTFRAWCRNAEERPR